jgi:hypothetical protein
MFPAGVPQIVGDRNVAVKVTSDTRHCLPTATSGSTTVSQRLRDQRFTTRAPQDPHAEHGYGFVGLLLTVLLLGGLAAVVMVAMGGSSRDHNLAISPIQAPSAGQGGAASDIAAAASVACRADYQAVSNAASYYQAMNGKAPATMASLGSFLKDPVTSSRFAITINPARPGQVEVAAGGYSAAPGDGNCAYAG